MRKDYPILPVPFSNVTLQDQFWQSRIQTNIDVTIPFALESCEKTGRIKNFEIAGGAEEGAFCSRYPFDDSDVYKIIEGASYTLQVQPNPALETYLDTLIAKIGRAQEPDGYLYTNRTINPDAPHEWASKERWKLVHDLSHELYNVGHLYEAAVAHFQATGKRNLLDIAIKNADLVDKDFGYGKIENYPGHQVIETGLVKLYRVTNDERYLNLAKFFLDIRGPNGEKYNQSHAKVVDQHTAVGHAVRAAYMFAGMADVASITKDKAYIEAIEAIWNDVVQSKLYVTGGIGATGNNEGFDAPYLLPNRTAYNETCASIANVFWNHRLFLMQGEAKYMDVLECTLYNALLSGIGLSGNRFFYPNVLESDGTHERQPWFECACCPSNVTRFLPSVPGYIYAQNEKGIYVNLFIASEATIQTQFGESVTIQQESNYPWEGEIQLSITPKKRSTFSVFIRIPGWATNQPVPSDLYYYDNSSDAPVTLIVNGKKQTLKPQKGYVEIHREWEQGDTISLSLPMPIRKVLAHENVEADAGRFALQKGPLVFALEGKDQASPSILSLLVEKDVSFQTNFEPDLLGGVDVISFTGFDTEKQLDGTIKVADEARLLKAIPYFAWANRGASEMMVWLPFEKAQANAKPAPTLAYLSKASASRELNTVNTLSDQFIPKSSDDHTHKFLHWWPQKGTTEWVQYDFPTPTKVSKTEIYWFDDTGIGECRIPKSWRLLYKEGNTWKPVASKTPYTITLNAFDKLNFDPVTTTSLRLEVQLPKDFSSGIHEWVVE